MTCLHDSCSFHWNPLEMSASIPVGYWSSCPFWSGKIVTGMRFEWHSLPKESTGFHWIPADSENSSRIRLETVGECNILQQNNISVLLENDNDSSAGSLLSGDETPDALPTSSLAYLPLMDNSNNMNTSLTSCYTTSTNLFHVPGCLPRWRVQ
jgi:hypothetical protein